MLDFLHYGNHTPYIISAYCSVFFLLGVQWLLPWLRFKKQLNNYKKNEQTP